ncbi:hypothetical protein [Halovivax gelatinilyticus]|uniref:hypothetical protein n=1 Tax=Halovivax gelatinilyticus TaxID=2961597 RepID=UPI0020CA5B8F|nr:hypothetical protein [Halovivax gelatinilyticus]
MSEYTIEISEANWRRLCDLRRSNESIDDVLTRLTRDHRWTGFDALSETGLAEEMESVREQLEREIEPDRSESE